MGLKISENTLHKQVVSWCRKQPEANTYLLCYHIENELPMGSIIKKALGDKFWAFVKERQLMGLLAGASDLHFPNLLLYMELKTTSGKLSDTQRGFINNVYPCHDVVIPRSSFEAVSLLRDRMEWFKNNDVQTQIRNCLTGN